MSNISRPSQAQPVYTYQLPYGVRRDICNLLDADQSWKTLGGQYIGLDATQLSLLYQAYLRHASPTEELLNKYMDNVNFRVSDLCFYLKQMDHCRAFEILKRYTEFSCNNNNDGQNVAMNTSQQTLYTPTPSFANINQPPAAIMDASLDFDANNFDFQLQQQLANKFAAGDMQANKQKLTRTNPNIDPPQQKEQRLDSQQQGCHRSRKLTNESNNRQQVQTPQAQQQQQQRPKDGTTNQDDPGEEIVRLACANNRKRTSISDQEVVNQLRLIMQINYSELKQASNDFSNSNILGNGGFASVYRGFWKGTDVAIKRLRCNLMDQALNELTILNSYRIDNILPIYGISIDGPEACLVYQFMSNGSLEDRLSCKNNTQPLNWNQRALIGEGVAKGLYYLHTLRDKPLVHGDVKSANVLLDAQFVPKLGDFGLARQVFKGKNPQTELCTHCTVSSIHGTSVYLPPEYLRHKILSPAVDVYSYGIVLLEMATGKRAYDGKRLLIDLVEDETRSMSMGQIGYSLKDPRLLNDTQSDLKIWFELLIKLGINCAHKIKKKRPDIGQVLNHFANYRSNSDATLLGSDSLNNGLFMSNGTSSTTRTLTPDQKSAMLLEERKNHNLKKEEKLTRINEHQQEQQRNLDSALMSFEEQHRQPNGKEKVETYQDADQQQQPQVAVEAMIPLLTELGLDNVKSQDL